MRQNRITNILFVGLGGHGVLKASEIAAEVFAEAGCDVKMTSSQGISQRGGAIDSHLRVGDKIYAPTISYKEADFLLAMELVEACRWSGFMKKKGIVIYSDRCFSSDRSVKQLKEWLADRHGCSFGISFQDTIKRLARIETYNIFMLGVLSNFLEVEGRLWQQVIKKSFSAALGNYNIAAFNLGRSTGPNRKEIFS